MVKDSTNNVQQMLSSVNGLIFFPFILMLFLVPAIYSSHEWYNKDRGMCYPVCGIVHIKERFATDRKE